MQLKTYRATSGTWECSTRKHCYFPTCYLSGSRTMRRFATRIQIVNLMIFFPPGTKESMNSSGSQIKESGRGADVSYFLLL